MSYRPPSRAEINRRQRAPIEPAPRPDPSGLETEPLYVAAYLGAAVERAVQHYNAGDDHLLTFVLGDALALVQEQTRRREERRAKREQQPVDIPGQLAIEAAS